MRFFACLLIFGICCVPAGAAPTAPSGLTATALSHHTVALSWNDNSSNEAGFIIGQRIAPATMFSGIADVAAGTTSVNIINRSGNTSYEFVVVAYDANDAQSPFSNIASVTTPPGVTSSNFRAAYLQEPFSFSLTSTNPAQVTGYAISALPQGLVLNAATGAITGTPTAAGKTTGQVTITHTGNLTATAPLTLHVFVDPPGRAVPVAGPDLPALTLTTFSPSAPISLAGVFTDPDVASAARLTTDLGTLDFAFFPGSAPQTVANFLGYLNRGDFLNTIFHRNVPGFIIQAGAFRADATASAVPTQPPVINEPGITNLRGTVAMAKVGGNPDSATNQFFINLADNALNLDNQNEGFTVFARIAGNGMAVADAIAALPTRNYSAVNGALTDTPVRGVPPPAYDPTTLVRISQATVLAPLTLTALSSSPGVVSASLNGTDLTLTPHIPGTSLITLTATDLDNQSAVSTFNVTVQDAYGAWAATQSFALPADALPEADPDKDGLINLLEFVLVSPPLAGSAVPLAPLVAGNHLTLTFSLRSQLGGTTVQLQSAPATEGPWTTRWSATEGFTHPWIAGQQPQGDFSIITARDPDPLDPARRFLRLRATRP